MDTLKSYFNTFFMLPEEKPPLLSAWQICILCTFTAFLSYMYVFKKDVITRVAENWIKRPSRTAVASKWRTMAHKDSQEDHSGVFLSFPDDSEDDPLRRISDFKTAASHYRDLGKPNSKISVDCKTFSQQEISVSKLDGEETCHKERRKMTTMSRKRTLSSYGKEKLGKSGRIMQDTTDNEFQVTMYCRIRSSLSKKNLLTSDVGARTTPLKLKVPDNYYRNKSACETPQKSIDCVKVSDNRIEQNHSEMTRNDDPDMAMVGSADHLSPEIKRFKKRGFDEAGENCEKLVDSLSEGGLSEGGMTEAGTRIQLILKKIETEARKSQNLLKKASGLIGGGCAKEAVMDDGGGGVKKATTG